MYIHNINPVLLEFFNLEIRYYGLAYVLGFFIVLLWLMYYRGEMGMSKDEVYDFLFYITLGIIIGSRLFHIVFWEPTYYFSHPWKIMYLWEGGMAFHGGLVGSIVAGWIYAKKKGVSFWKLADIMAIPSVIALALGRLANFTNAELYGPLTNVSWCVDFGDGQCRHPYQIYAALKRFAVAGILIAMTWKKKYKDGFVFWMMIFLLGLGRFALDFLREDKLYLGLSVGQWMSLAMVFVASYILWKKHKSDLRKLFK